jgi:hypothetical protein
MRKLKFSLEGDRNVSSISSRPRVQKIDGPVLATLEASGAVLAVEAVSCLLGSTIERAGPFVNVAPALQPVANLRQEFGRLWQNVFEKARVSLPPADAVRYAVAQSLAATPFYVNEAVSLEPHCSALRQSTTLAEARHAADALLSALESGHHNLFVDTLSSAACRAAARVGFESTTVVRLPGQVRVIAEDARGRTLITEIQADPRRAPAVATEIVGMTDPSCQQILDDFDQALEAQGLHSAPPRRKFTGGVCELAATREFVRMKVKPRCDSDAVGHTKPNVSMDRARRLNRPMPAKTQSKG